ncbi:MAG: universal stress protein [Candidatus Nanopelagicales bacterium]
MSDVGKDIVVGFDGSDQAQAASRFAIREAIAMHLPLRLLHSFTPPMGGAGLGYGTILPADALDSMRDGIAVHLAQEAAAMADSHPGLDVSETVSVGNSAACLIDASKSAALVVVGSRGMGGFKGLILGSTGIQVAAHAQCPVAVVRGEPAVSANTVVVGLDGSDMSQAALSWAFGYASRHGYGLRVVHAWTVPSFDLLAAPAGPAPADATLISQEETRATAEALAGFRSDFPDVEVSERVVQQHPVAALLSESADATAIVVGTHGRGEVMSALLGSVSQGVLHKAKVPVVVVGPTTYSDGTGLGT